MLFFPDCLKQSFSSVLLSGFPHCPISSLLLPAYSKNNSPPLSHTNSHFMVLWCWQELTALIEDLFASLGTVPSLPDTLKLYYSGALRPQMNLQCTRHCTNTKSETALPQRAYHSSLQNRQGMGSIMPKVNQQAKYQAGNRTQVSWAQVQCPTRMDYMDLTISITTAYI